jgi:hypothetical protein
MMRLSSTDVQGPYVLGQDGLTHQAVDMLADVAEKYLIDGEEVTKADFVKRLGRRVEDEDETREQRRGEKLRRGRKVELMLTKIWAGQLRSA